VKILQWSIYLANLDPVIGSEQGKTRPVLVISEDFFNELLNVINIIPLTTFKEGRTIYPNEALLEKEDSSLENNSIALVHQIRTIDKKRLIKYLGQIKNSSIQEEIKEAIRFQFGL
jgi:mRNA interferase MazF